MVMWASTYERFSAGQILETQGDSIRDLQASPIVGGHLYNPLKGSRFHHPKKVTA